MQVGTSVNNSLERYVSQEVAFWLRLQGKNFIFPQKRWQKKTFQAVEITWAKSLNQQRTGLMQGSERMTFDYSLGVKTWRHYQGHRMKEVTAHGKELECILIVMANHWSILNSKCLLNCTQVTLMEKCWHRDENERRETSLLFSFVFREPGKM